MVWCASHHTILLIRGRVVSEHWVQKYFACKDRATVGKGGMQKVLAAVLLELL